MTDWTRLSNRLTGPEGTRTRPASTPPDHVLVRLDLDPNQAREPEQNQHQNLLIYNGPSQEQVLTAPLLLGQHTHTHTCTAAW